MATGPGARESECSDATASSSMDSYTDDSSTEVPTILSRLRSCKLLSIIGATLSIIQGGNLRIAL